MAKDLTMGKPSSVLIKFAIPMILANIFQQLYNLADSIIAGNVLGVNALSATSVSYPVTLIYTGIAIGASQGAAVVIANLMGSRRYRDMSTAVGTTLLSMFAASVVLTVVGVLVCDPVLKLLKTDEVIFADSSDYLAIYTYGVPFVMLYNAATAAFNAMGDSRTPLILLICSSVVNVVLDLVFTVEQCGICWGVSGLAWATFRARRAPRRFGGCSSSCAASSAPRRASRSGRAGSSRSRCRNCAPSCTSPCPACFNNCSCP